MITGTLTVDDYIAAHRLHYARARGNIYAATGLIIIIGIAIAISGANWAPIVLFAGVGGCVGNWWGDRVRLPTKVRKLYDQFKGIGEPVELWWDREKIEARSASGQGTRNWRDYARFAESEDMFLLYATDALWYAFPKRWFVGDAQLEEFRTYAKTAGAT